MRRKNSRRKFTVLLLLTTVFLSAIYLYAVVWRPSTLVSSPKAATFICTILQESEPVANVDITLELSTTDGDELNIDGVSESNGSVSMEMPMSFNTPVLLRKVALRGTWMIQTATGDRTYRLPERRWYLADPQAFLNGYSNYTFREVRLQQSEVDDRVYLSLKLEVLPARLMSVYNPLSEEAEISLLTGRSWWSAGEYMGFNVEDANFVPAEESALVVAPVDQPLRLAVLAKILDFSWNLKIEVEMNNRNFVDLSAPIVRALYSAQIQQLSKALDTLAANGFDTTEQSEKVGKIQASYEKAALAMELGDSGQGLELVEKAWGFYTEVYFHIREIYANTLPWTVSVTLILAFLSVTMAHLVCEDEHVRNLLMVSVFLGFMSVFAYSQPFFRLFLIAFIGAVEKLDIYLLISLVQMLPWIIIVALLFAYPKFRDLLWESFGVTIKNMRRRKLRTLLTLSTIIVVSTSAMYLLSIAPYVPSNRIPLSGVKPMVPNGLVVSRYEVLIPRPVGGEKAARSDSYPLTIPAYEAAWMVNHSNVARSNIYGLRQVRISNSTGQGLSDFSIFYFVAVKPSFVNDFCALIRSEDASLDDYDDNTVLIGSRIAEAYGFRIGDEILIEDRTFKVKGIFNETQVVNEWKEIDGRNFFFIVYDPLAGTISGESFLIGSIRDFQLDALGIYKVSLILSDVGELDDFAENLLQRGYSHEVTPLYDITRTYFVDLVKNGAVTSAYYGSSRFALVGPWYAHTVVIALSAMMIFINIFASINERKGDILAMHVVGASPIRIRLVFIAEALAIGLMGGIYGYVVGYLFARTSNLIAAGAIRLDLAASTPFIISISTSVLSSVLGSLSPSKKAILTVVPSRRMLQRNTDIFLVRDERAFIDIPIRIRKDELASFDSFLANFVERFPPVRYGYDGLSVLDIKKKDEERELTYTIQVNYAVERSLYYKVTIVLMKGEEPRKVQMVAYPLDPWERKVTYWSREHYSLLPRLAACLRNELLKYAEWK